MAVRDEATCGVPVLDPADFEQCSTPALTLDDQLFPAIDTIAPVGTGLLVGDLQVSVDLTYTFIGEMTTTVDANGVSLTLHDEDGIDEIGIITLFDDTGVPNGSPYDSGLIMQPSGPGQLVDFTGSAITGLAAGERALVVKNTAAFEALHGPGMPPWPAHV